MVASNENPYILDLRQVSRDETGLVGAKAANLGELAGADFPVPEGFVLTTRAFDRFMQANALDSGSSPT